MNFPETIKIDNEQAIFQGKVSGSSRAVYKAGDRFWWVWRPALRFQGTPEFETERAGYANPLD